MRDAAQVAGMPCPNCRTPLALADRQGVEIDYCPNCRGVWLDRGELDKIIERSVQDFAAPPPPPEQRYPQSQPAYGVDSYRPDRGSGHKPYRKKKSFLEELFD